MGYLNRSAPPVLLVDADVFIDYRDSDLEVLKLIGQHVGRVAVLAPVLDAVHGVHGVTRADCARLSVSVVEVATSRLLRAGSVDMDVSLSFNDRLCFVTCREEGWTCVTNDPALRRLCERRGVPARFGLRLLVDVVAAGTVTPQRATAIAHKMQESNPLHVNERVIARFKNELGRLGTGST